MPRELAGKMEELALALADKSLSNLPADRESIDAFKALSVYFLGTEKLGKGEEEDPEDTGGFSGIRRRIAEAGNTPINGAGNKVDN